jgi:hypothetical protein
VAPRKSIDLVTVSGVWEEEGVTSPALTGLEPEAGSNGDAGGNIDDREYG